jgi:hypothetical protein
MRTGVEANAPKVTILYSIFGRHFNFLEIADVPVAPNDRPQMVSWMAKITEFVRQPVCDTGVLLMAVCRPVMARSRRTL